jgi:hypothetical protein
VQCSAVQCSAVQCSAVQCSAVQCSAVQCSAVQCSAVHTVNCTKPSLTFAQKSPDGKSGQRKCGHFYNCTSGNPRGNMVRFLDQQYPRRGAGGVHHRIPSSYSFILDSLAPHSTGNSGLFGIKDSHLVVSRTRSPIRPQPHC